MEYIELDQINADEAVALYESVGWSSYTSDSHLLVEGIKRSTFWVTARQGGVLVGLVRCLSDDFSIFYLQDVLVHPQHQRQGIGRALIDRCLTRFEHVRQRVLLTDNEDHQHRLYRAAGYHDVALLKNDRLHAFVSIKGVALS